MVECNLETRIIKTKDEFNELKGKIENYNKNKDNKYFINDLKCCNNNVVTFRKYKKLTFNSTLDKLDLMTTKFENSYELKRFFNIDARDNHKLYIAYLYNGVKLLDVFYKKDKELFDRNFLRSELELFGRDINFINELLSNRKIKNTCNDSLDDFEGLYTLRELLLYNNPEDVSTSLINKFFYSFINEKNRFNYNNYRLLAEFVKKYRKDIDKNEQTKQEQKDIKDYPIFGQMVLEQIELEELRNKYEEMKIKQMDGEYLKLKR